MITLIAGLGNPGAQYSKTRHNAGFWLVDLLAHKFGGSWNEKNKLQTLVAKITTESGKLILIKPQTFMNKSGISLQACTCYFKINVEQVLVVHDEIDLPVGEVRLKIAGGHGGNNGLRDIISHIGNEFNRIRIGIGHPGHKDRVHDYVLSKPSLDETILIERAIDRTVACMPDWQQGKLQSAMQYLHQPQIENGS